MLDREQAERIAVGALVLVALGVAIYFAVRAAMKPKNKEETTPPGGSTTPPSRAKPKVIVPLYIYPNAAVYDRTNAVADVVIVNPNNGTDAINPPNVDWVAGLDRLSKPKLYGYIFTQYGTRAMANVEQEIEGYKTNWGKYVKGIFVDEVDATNTTYYTELCTFAQTQGFDLILNPGVRSPGLFKLPGVAAVVQYEGPQVPTEPFEDREKTVVMVHSQPDLKSLAAVKELAGYYYVTTTDAYHEGLPSYFDDLKA